jgi:DNA repair exonuclease SbcCD nuclease subunit
MIRFIHTADLQIGKQFESLAAPADRLAFLRQARIDVIQRIGAVARERNAAAVLVAGDVFERPEIREVTIRQTLAAISETQVCWILLPGNHDPDGPAGLWERVIRIGVPANVIIARGTQPILLAGGALAVLAAPLTRNHQFADPTTHFDMVETEPGCVRVGIAHGSVRNRLCPAAETHNMICESRTDEARMDYLALGDWHRITEIAPKAWYSGTPEPDNFNEASGYVLAVEIAGPGSSPTVEPVHTGQYIWQEIEATVHSPGGPAGLTAVISGIAVPHDHAVVDLRIQGTLSLAERTEVDEIIANLEATVRVLRTDLSNLKSLPTEADLDELGRHGYLAEVVSRLRLLEGTVGNPDSCHASDAVRRLYLEHMGGRN